MKISIYLIGICAFLLFACGKEESPKKTPSNNNGTTQVSLEDTLSRTWTVVSATHKGAVDNSSKGLELQIRKDGSYTLITTGYIGTWEFQNDKKEVLLDKDQSTLKTTWTIQSISSSSLKVSFISPFTGGDATWDLESN